MIVRTIASFFLVTSFFLAPVQVSADPFDQSMEGIAEQLVVISEALAADKTDGISEAAEAILLLTEKLKPEESTGEHAKHFKAIPAQVQKGAQQVIDAKDLKGAREAFKVLTAPVVMWAKMVKPAGFYVVYCGMQKASWLQKDDTVRNPYHGSEMLHCGQVQSGPEESEGKSH